MTNQTSNVIVTKHAKKRIHKRLGIPIHSVQKLAENALENGKQHKDYKGSFLKYLNWIYRKESAANGIRIWNNHIFLFKGSTLITAYIVPEKMRRLV